MSGKARRRFLWTGVLLALVGLLPIAPRPAYAGLAALDSFHIGRYHLANGERTKALDAFNDALRLNPQFVQAYVARGKLYAEMGQYESALVDLNFALRLQPTHAEAFAYRGFANLSLGKLQDAMPDLDMALRIDPSYARVHFLRGQALKLMGDEQGSAGSIAMAKRLDPTLEVSQVVTASANGSINDHAIQLGGNASPQRTPVTNDLMPTESRTMTRADRRMQGRLVPFEKHPDLVDIAPPSASRLPDGTQLPPGFSVDRTGPRAGLGGGMSSGVLRNRRGTTTIIEDRAMPSGGKIPDLTSPPTNNSADAPKAGPTKSADAAPNQSPNKSIEALPAETMPTVEPAAVVAGGTTPSTKEATGDRTTDLSEELEDELAELIPIPSTEDLLKIVPYEVADLPPVVPMDAPVEAVAESTPAVVPLPPIAPTEMPSETVAVSAAPAVSQENSTNLLGDMGMPPIVMIEGATALEAVQSVPGIAAAAESFGPEQAPPVVAASTNEPIAAPALSSVTPVEPSTEKIVMTEFEPPTELSASEILKRRQTQGFVLPSKLADAEHERRLAAAVDNARAGLGAGVSTIVGDDVPTPTPNASTSPSTTVSIGPEAAQIADVEYRRGLKLEAEGDLNGAIAAYRQAIEVNPTDPQVFCRRGHLLVESERNAEALADFNAAIKLAPGLSNGYYGRAHVHYVTQQLPEACDDYTIAIRLDDQHAQAFIERGHCLALLGKLPEAKTDREAALALDPSLAKTGPKYSQDNIAPIVVVKPVMTGATAFAGDDSNSATTADAKPVEPAATSLEPAVPNLQTVALPTLQAIPATPDAIVSDVPNTNTNTTTSPSAPAVTVSDAAAPGTTIEAAKLEAAKVEAAVAPQAGSAFDGLFVKTRPTPSEPSTITKLSGANAAVASDDKASVIVSDDAKFDAAPVQPAATTAPVVAPSALPEVVPAVMPPVADMTDAAMASDDETAPTSDDKSAVPTPAAVKPTQAPPRDRATLERDLQRLNEELSAHPGDAVRYYERAKTSLELGDATVALEDVNIALRLNASHPESLRLRAGIQSQSGKFTEALADLDEVVRLNAADAGALSERGYARLATGRTNDAVADFTDALKSEPDDVATLCRRGMAFALLGDRDRSLADFNAAQKVAPQDAEVLLCRAKAQAEFGNKREAVADLSAAIKLNPKSAEAYFERSRLYAERGAYENAQADRRRALELDPALVR